MHQIEMFAYSEDQLANVKYELILLGGEKKVFKKEQYIFMCITTIQSGR